MDRWACVSLPAFPLQLVARRNPAWRGLPMVVVSEDTPQGKVLWADRLALDGGVLPGQRYALALSLCRGLRACTVERAEIEAATHEVKALLWCFSPSIEASDEAGVFWLDASGLGRLYPSLQTWVSALQHRFAGLQLQATIVVGFSRFASYAWARANSESKVWASAAQERAAVARIPLACLDVEPEFRDVLDKLGVRTIEALLRLPAGGLLSRFGQAARRLHELAAGGFAPMTAETWVAPLLSRALLDDAERDTTRLLFIVKRLLDELLAKLALRGEALCSLTLSLSLDRKHGTVELEPLRPAEPTLDGVQLMDLVRLRLETLRLSAGAIEVALEVQGVVASVEQLKVFAEQPRRDLAAAKRAIARLRAEFGDRAVVRAVLRQGHLPEACFAWEPLEEVKLPQLQQQGEGDLAPWRRGEGGLLPGPQAGEAQVSIAGAVAATGASSPAPLVESVVRRLARRPLVRRIFQRPQLLSAPARQLRDDGWLIRGADCGPVTHSAGPYVLAGGWWQREVHREYHFMLTRRGELLWAYQDKRRRRWLLHGEVL